MRKIVVSKNDTENTTIKNMNLKFKNLNRAAYSKHLLHYESLKATEKRMAILTIFQKIRSSLCAEDVQQILSKTLLKISPSTLYRILKTLEEKDLIKKSNPPDEYIIPQNKRDRTFYILK